ncbi:MAG: hypothetical protein KAJ14_10875 [Candidatus Omnitrophica bacterium]|nr:hypothetical protein [Candidatus Omnitrophota bacterium]MCK5287801.1 hypothetical protein [Candidatus Omnitrophota bacterium]MCK5392710.1 hypothetical protein [Candidatus Omnitrophota bacterium]MCK5493602.1 hypothetical protein [Candidatus Omnitrophota bacterium]
MRKRKGQSILEYVIVLTVIVVAIALGAKTYLTTAIDTSFSNAQDTMDAGTNSLVP